MRNSHQPLGTDSIDGPGKVLVIFGSPIANDVLTGRARLRDPSSKAVPAIPGPRCELVGQDSLTTQLAPSPLLQLLHDGGDRAGIDRPSEDSFTKVLAPQDGAVESNYIGN